MLQKSLSKKLILLNCFYKELLKILKITFFLLSFKDYYQICMAIMI